MFKYPVKKIKIALIDHKDSYFQITKKLNEDKMINSIKAVGLLEPPVLLGVKDKYIIVSGFNRINAIKKLGGNYVDALTVDRVERGHYIKYNLLKILRGEIGPVGKIKFILILKNYFSMSCKEIEEIIRESAIIPEMIFSDGSVMDRIVQLPRVIRDYADLKDLSYKILKKIIRLPARVQSSLCRWINAGLVRVNIFKEITDMIYDIIRRDNNHDEIINIACGNCENRRKFEEYLFESIFRLRYPHYSRKKENARRIIKELSDNRTALQFPDFFERDTIVLKLTVSKNDDLKKISDKFSRMLDSERFKELIDML